MKWARKTVSIRVILLFCLAFFSLGIHFGLQLYAVVPSRGLIVFLMPLVSLGVVLVANYLRFQEAKGSEVDG